MSFVPPRRRIASFASTSTAAVPNLARRAIGRAVSLFACSSGRGPHERVGTPTASRRPKIHGTGNLAIPRREAKMQIGPDRHPSRLNLQRPTRHPVA